MLPEFLPSELASTLTILILQPCWECLVFSSTTFPACPVPVGAHKSHILAAFPNGKTWKLGTLGQLQLSLVVQHNHLCCLTPLSAGGALCARPLLCELASKGGCCMGSLTQLWWKPGSAERMTSSGLGTVSLGNCFQRWMQPRVCYITGNSGQDRTLIDCLYFQNFPLGT